MREGVCACGTYHNVMIERERERGPQHKAAGKMKSSKSDIKEDKQGHLPVQCN